MKQLQQLRKLAEAYLEATSGYVKEAAETFFKEMDIDGNGVVDRTEFMEFMRIASIETEYKSLSLFESLCKINQTKLDFLDVMTLFYIIQSGRPFCATCAEFITDTYFCCRQCFRTKDRYCVCFKCFQEKHYKFHCHGGDQFLDNFTLLEFCRRNHHDSPEPVPPLSSSSSSYPQQTNNYGGPLVINVPAQPTTYNYYGPALPPTAGYGSSLAIVPAQPTPSYYGPALPPTVGYGSGLASVPAQPTPSYYGPTLPPTVGYGSGLASVPAQPTPSYYDGPTLPPTVDHGCLAIVPAGPANLTKRERILVALRRFVQLIHIGGSIAQISACSIQ